MRLLTNHARVMVYLADNPEATAREMALSLGVTERAIQRIVADLDTAGCLTARRRGRGKTYMVLAPLTLLHHLRGIEGTT